MFFTPLLPEEGSRSEAAGVVGVTPHNVTWSQTITTSWTGENASVAGVVPLE